MANFRIIVHGREELMNSVSLEDDAVTIEVSGFRGLNLFDFIKAEIPENRWPARIRIVGVTQTGRVAAKIHYVDIDGTNAEAVTNYLDQNSQVSVTEVECEIDFIQLLTEAAQLDVILPNTARLITSYAMSIKG